MRSDSNTTEFWGRCRVPEYIWSMMRRRRAMIEQMYRRGRLCAHVCVCVCAHYLFDVCARVCVCSVSVDCVQLAIVSHGRVPMIRFWRRILTKCSTAICAKYTCRYLVRETARARARVPLVFVIDISDYDTLYVVVVVVVVVSQSYCGELCIAVEARVARTASLLFHCLPRFLIRSISHLALSSRSQPIGRSMCLIRVPLTM